MGMTWDEWNNCPPEYYQYKFRGFSKLKMQEARRQWEIARFVAFFSVAPHMKPSGKNNPIVSFYPFPWDKKTLLPEKTLEEILAENRETLDKLTPVNKDEALNAQVAVDAMTKIAKANG